MLLLKLYQYKSSPPPPPPPSSPPPPPPRKFKPIYDLFWPHDCTCPDISLTVVKVSIFQKADSQGVILGTLCDKIKGLPKRTCFVIVQSVR
jgi:hypothetical protein